MESNSGQPTPNPSPSSFPPAPDRHWEQWSPALVQKTLQQGMTALKKQQYEQAIALLEPILNHVSQPKVTAQIHKALAKAYMAQRNAPEALRYCQALQQHPEPMAQQWARNAIAHLQKQYPQLDLSKPLEPTPSLNNADRLKTASLKTDSLKVDSLKVDSLKAGPPKTDPLKADKLTVSPSPGAKSTPSPARHSTTDDANRTVSITSSITSPAPPAPQPIQPSVLASTPSPSPSPSPIPAKPDTAKPALADTGFKPLSPDQSQESHSNSPLAELLRKLDHAPSASPAPTAKSPSSTVPSSNPTALPSPPAANVQSANVQSANVQSANVQSANVQSGQGQTSGSAATGSAATESLGGVTSTPTPTDIPPQPLPSTAAHQATDQAADQATDQASEINVSDSTLIQSSDLSVPDVPNHSKADPESVPNPKLDVKAARLSMVAIAALPWKQANRAKRWSPIPNKLTFTRRLNTFLTYAWTAIALWGMATFLLQVGMALGDPVRELVSNMVRFNRWYFLEYYPGRLTAMILAGLLLLAPLILHVWLCWSHKTRRFTLDELGRHSPEAQKLLRHSCKKHKHPLPRLRRIATQTPVLLSYGWRPRMAWIVVSDGLLRQLSDDEIAALYAAELSHVRQWSLWLITGFTVATQVFYSFYQFFAQWSDRRKNSLLQWLGGTGAAIAYGLFWLVRNAGLWLARSRRRHSDRIAANLTGNPNGLVRGLLKFAIATATDIRRQGKTEPILEQVEWLMPVGYRSAISVGSVFPVQWQTSGQSSGRSSGRSSGQSSGQDAGQEQIADTTKPTSLDSTILTWDYRNSYRNWMAVNNTHPPLGDRLYTLTRYAQHWRLEPELSLPSSPRIPASGKMQQQVAPFVGLPIGAGISMILWIMGIVANHFNWPIEWLRYEAVSIFWGMLAMGFSFGTILRINAFFPDIPSSTQSESELSDLLTQPDRLPIDSQPIHLEGKLLGRHGASNWLNQDLILQTQTGMVRLHCISMLGTMGHLVFDVIRLTPLKGRTVTVIGWLRRGATPWIDVHTIQSKRGKPIQAGHPIWSTLLAAGLALWGAYILYQTNL